MRVESFADVGRFLSETADFRSTEPVLTNVIGTIAAGVQSGRTYETCLLLAVRDADGAVVGCAARTSPWNLVVSPMPVGAATVLAAHVVEVDPGVPGVTGARAVVEAMLPALPGGESARIAMVDTVRVIDEYIPPSRPTAGGPRRAAAQDRARLIEWLIQFGIDASLPLRDVEAAVDPRLDAGTFWFWEVDGEPVSLAGHAAVVATPAGNVGRIGPVYTPAEHRGNGYAAAVTAKVAEILLPACVKVMLYADATNPTSNAVYERLGFRAVAEVIEIELPTAPNDFDNHFH